MAVSYKKLWHILLDRDLKKKEAERAEPEAGRDKGAAKGKPQQTVHKQPAAKKKKPKAR